MKKLRCSDAGFDCKYEVKGSSDEEVLKKAAEHAQQVHHVQVTPEMAAQIRTLIREEA